MKLGSAFAAATTMLLLAGGAHAADYNATTSFNGTGQGGAFSYGTQDAAGVFTAFSTTSADCAGNANFLCANDGALVPGVGTVIGGGSASFSTVVVPSGTLWAHPGVDTQTDIVFTAPVSGTYVVNNLNFERLDTTSNGNGVQIGTLFNGGSAYKTLPPTVGYGGQDGVFSTATLNLDKGDSFTAFVNNNGDYTYDSTGINFDISGPDAISAAPEPGAWALMFAGVAMMGAMLRRRRQGVALAA